MISNAKSRSGAIYRYFASSHAELAELTTHRNRLDLLSNAAAIHERGDDETLRLCDQAFFTKLHIDVDNHVRAETWADDPATHTRDIATRDPVSLAQV
ncbi:hypothetical protein [Amycolatopsis sp. GM8]|uniref:hypothetical protein n=1 Tax=Amycolatopsis sp. GM8 TaxID=2896530 RepID=UPI001F1D1E9B|nr:hypothetical protein [Amycolatopsis sp. GM8]